MRTHEKQILTKIGKINLFKTAIEKLTRDTELTDKEKQYLLSCAIIFSRAYESDNRFSSYVEFAYYIILKYSLTYQDYPALYDFSAGFGFYPITKKILDNGLIEGLGINDCCVDIALDRFFVNSYTETKHQYSERTGLLAATDSELLYVAPTSFGKSSVIIDFIRNIKMKDPKIVIVVPTKSLLMQTYRMIREANLDKKILIHDEMYQGEKTFIAIFTQERSLRLMSRSNVIFDILFIDEAHNMLKYDERSILLSRLISKNRNMNVAQQVIYLSPLVDDEKNLKTMHNQQIRPFKIPFNIKEPEIFEYRADCNYFKFNRFVGEFYKIGKVGNMFSYIKLMAKQKNFLYNRRPVKIEQLAKELSRHLDKIEVSRELEQVLRTLKDEVHEKFYMIEYLEYGIIYLHGKLPDIIKEYLESKFRDVAEIKYVIANSVILEGMNLPIDNLYILNTRTLQGKELTNLIGRVNRLNTIFSSPGNTLDRLLPPVHFINNSEHNGENGNMRNKIQLLRSRVFTDDVDNPTLHSFDMQKIVRSNAENVPKYEKTIQNEQFLNKRVSSDLEKLKQYLLETGINNFYDDVDKVAVTLKKRIDMLSANRQKWDSLLILEKIYYVFLKGIDNVIDFEFKRLEYEEARRYYQFHIDVVRKWSLKESVNHLFTYYKKRANGSNPLSYFGKSYGEVQADTSGKQTFNKNYVNLAGKSDEKLVNLAIVKLKMEDDFINIKLHKFIIMLHDYKLISNELYNICVYGTTDKHKIALTKLGLSLSLISRLETDGQLSNLYLDNDNNLRGNSALEKFKLTINDLYRFEMDRFLG